MTQQYPLRSIRVRHLSVKPFLIRFLLESLCISLETLPELDL
jgi:hypothetical protein